GREWQIVHGVSAQEIRKRNVEALAKGCEPIDVAGYVPAADGEKPTESYACVWARSLTKDGAARLFVGEADTKHNDDPELTKDGFGCAALHQFLGVDRRPRYSSIWRKPLAEWNNAWARHQGSYESELSPSRLQVDVCVARAAEPLSPRQAA